MFVILVIMYVYVLVFESSIWEKFKVLSLRTEIRGWREAWLSIVLLGSNYFIEDIGGVRYLSFVIRFLEILRFRGVFMMKGVEY